MKAKIKSKEEVARQTYKIIFDLLGEKVNFQAGQYIYVTVPNPAFDDNRGNRRHITISSPPENNTEIAITTRMGPSAFKKSLIEAPLGTEIDLGPIEGGFTLPEDTSSPVVFITGGIGITPYMSILGHIASQKLPYKITLIYSNRDHQSTAYHKQLKLWTKEIPDFKLIMTMTQDLQWSGEKRRIDAIFIKDYLPDVKSYIYYVSGPPGFVKGMKDVLKDAEIEGSNIKSEIFSGY